MYLQGRAFGTQPGCCLGLLVFLTRGWDSELLVHSNSAVSVCSGRLGEDGSNGRCSGDDVTLWRLHGVLAASAWSGLVWSVLGIWGMNQ